LGRVEAQLFLPGFLSIAGESLNDTPIPFVCIYVRATTFALELDPKSEGSD